MTNRFPDYLVPRGLVHADHKSADGVAAGAVALCDAGSEDTLNPCRVKIGLATACPMLTAALALAHAVHGQLITAAMRLHIVADKVDRIVLN